jgi:selenide, water dikinase
MRSRKPRTVPPSRSPQPAARSTDHPPPGTGDLCPMSSKLTSLSSCAGCAAKLGQEALAEILQRLPATAPDPNLLVNADTCDDAAVYRLDRHRALVQTVDFFTPIVDDPFAYGQIAAANAISDVYAMGGRPLTALNIVGMPADQVAPDVVAEILRGGLTKANEAGCAVVGGHTIRLPEPVYGMAVTGLVSPKHVIANTGARPGDWLVLTKPLGTGVVTTGIRRGLASTAIQRKAVRSMTALNRVGAELAEARLVVAGTDVTGFGLLGHLRNICRSSGVGAEIEAEALPVLGDEVYTLIEQDCVPGGSRKNLETAAPFTDWGGATDKQKHLLADAQTSGGLLLCVAPKRLASVLRMLDTSGSLCAALIGRIVHSPTVRVKILTGRRTSNTQHPTSNLQRPSPVPSLDVGCRMLGVGYSKGLSRGTP